MIFMNFFRFFVLSWCCFFGHDAFSQDSVPRDNSLITYTLEIPATSSLRAVTILLHGRGYQKFLLESALKILKNDLPKVHEYFQYVPRTQVHFVFGHDDRDANGAASVFPFNTIFLQDYPPTGDSSLVASHHWLRTLLVHEYVHIVTLEMTQGWMDTLRTFFGSSMKWAALNPRWFLEGIATWGEGYFTGQEEGRLKHPLIRQAVKNALLQPDFCHDFSCWDIPARFPYGSLAYWLGAAFLADVETKKPGTLRCWAQQNASHLPFFVGNRFEACTGKDIFQAYAEFRHDFLQRESSPYCPWSDEATCSIWQHQQIYWDSFKGVAHTDLYAAAILNKGSKGSAQTINAEQLWLWDKKKQKESFFSFTYPIEKIYGANSQGFYLTMFYPGLDEADRLFGFFDLKTKTLKTFSDDACHEVKIQATDVPVLSYVYVLKKGLVCLYYQQQQWVWVWSHGDQSQIILRHLPLEAIYNPQVSEVDQKVSLSYWTKPLLTGGKLGTEGAFQQAEQKNILVDVAGSNASMQNLATPDLAKISSDVQVSNYQPWRYLYPNHLFIDYLSQGNIDSYGLSTSLSDPMARHFINLGLRYNTHLADTSTPWSGSAVYSYTPEDFSYSLGYQKNFMFYDVPGQDAKAEEAKFAEFGYAWTKRYWSIQSNLKVSHKDESDLFYDREIKSVQAKSEISYFKRATESGLKYSSMVPTVGVAKNSKSDESYLYYKILHEQDWKLGDDWLTRLYLAYGKMHLKSGTGLRDGSFYGGGSQATLFSGSLDFTSYLVPYGNLLGSEIFTGQLREDWTSFYSYNGSGLLPFFVKTFGPLIGLEYLSADYIIYKNEVEDDPRFVVAFAGAKLSTQIFYLLPLDIEFSFARALAPGRLRTSVNVALFSNIKF